jgi:hypothetical protein
MISLVKLVLLPVVVGAVCVLSVSGASARRTQMLVPWCRAQHMSLARSSGIYAGTGVSGWLLQLRNRTSTPCRLVRRPRLLLADAKGALPFAVTYHRRCVRQCSVIHPPGIQSTTATVAAHRSVFVAFTKYRCDEHEYRAADRVRLRLDATLVVSFRDYPDMGWCGPNDPGSRLDLSPFEPSAAEAIARTAP